MFDILKDIRSGALPISEIPGFIVWAIGKLFWLWFCVIAAGVVLAVIIDAL